MKSKAILFVHGLGVSIKSWGRFGALIEADKDIEYTPVFYKFPTFIARLFPGFQKKYSNIQTLARGLETFVEYKLQEFDEITLVGHSLGGLIIKQYLLNLNDINKLHKIKKIAFFAVPHNGSNWAKLSSLVSWDHQHLKQLCKNTDYLETLNDRWAQTKIENNFLIKNITASGDKVVSSESTKSIFRHLELIHIEGRGHINVIKPQDKEDLIFYIVKSLLTSELSITTDKPRGSLNIDQWHSKDAQNPFFPDEHRTDLINDIKSNAIKKKEVIRIIGLSGLGKTRTVFEAMNSINDQYKKDILYIDAAFEPPHLINKVNDWVSEGYTGILVVDNCSVAFHKCLLEAIKRNNSKLSLITIDSDLKTTNDCLIKELKRLDNKQIKEMLSQSHGDSLRDIDRIVEFSQGFPQMAVLIAKSRIGNEITTGILTDDFIAEKLLWGSSEKNKSDEEILCGCALFDWFGLDDEVSNEFEYIATNIVNIDDKTFYSCIKKFEDRGIIDRRGRYVQLVPKPLAIRLASQWWKRTRLQEQEKLIRTIPDSLVTSFCGQIEKLDTLPEVKELTTSLCGIQGPFGQAEVILSDRGSQLFRSFVNVNPDVISSTLYKILTSLKENELINIVGHTRRNIIGSLEKLCFHPTLFEESAWSLFLLALSENESWSNNATGTFIHLFSLQLSGNGADPAQRFKVLNEVLELNNPDADLIVIKALDRAIDVNGGSRVVGAEYQGMKAPLEEWKPQVWDEIFNYWEESFKLLLKLLVRGDKQKTEVSKTIGSSIRGFVNLGRIEMLENAINTVVSVNGKYWPEAIQNMKLAFVHKNSKLKSEGIDALKKWLNLLNPETANLEEKIKLIVSNPVNDYEKDKNGNYIDNTAIRAKNLARELSSNIESLYDFLPLLIEGEQKQTYTFAKEIILQIPDYDLLIQNVFKQLRKSETRDIRFCLGLLNGVFEKSLVNWDSLMQQIINDENLVRYYPEFLKTGEISKKYLDILLELIEKKTLPTYAPNVLEYGGFTQTVPINIIEDFCLHLSEFDIDSSWIALNIMYMRCFQDADALNKSIESQKRLVLNIISQEEINSRFGDSFHWNEIVGNILLCNDITFNIKLFKHIIRLTKSGADYAHIRNSFQTVTYELLKKNGEKIWPAIENEFKALEVIERYYLESLFKAEGGFANNQASPLTHVPIETIINWCENNKIFAPQFVASCLNIFDVNQKPTELFVEVLSRYGDIGEVSTALAANLVTRSWTGSIIPYLEADKKSLSPLLDHNNANVKTWVKAQIDYFNSEIKKEAIRDEEGLVGKF